MKYYSTKNHSNLVSLKTAVLQSLPPDNGLYMPERIQALPKKFIDNIDKYTFQDISYVVAHQFLAEDFSGAEILDIVESAINFEAPLVTLGDNLHVLELWHGPSLAFKDFGARFMATIMGRLVEGENNKLTILVATSGDTGGAVAAGFLGVDNVDIIILYPKGKVSPLQEKQLTTLGQNITALEVDGTFDDCQALVKKAFLDDDINQVYSLSSANSINITRLIPQTFYYFEAYKQLKANGEKVDFCIPSGNFGNLTAGLIAKKLGLPINKLIAATNANDIVPVYLDSGEYKPRPSIQTLSNAMDVGDPSNFRRMENLYGDSWESMKQDIVGYSYTDENTRVAVKEIFDRYNYVMDPHGAVGFLAAQEYNKEKNDLPIIILETAHPAKFLPVMNPILGDIDIPERLAVLTDQKKMATEMSIKFEDFKDWLLK